MPPILLGLAVVGVFVVLSQKGGLQNPFNPSKVTPSPPGPSAQAAGKAIPNNSRPGGFTPQGSGQTQGSPNSTLTTINGVIVVANNAMGLYDQIRHYTESHTTDSEYPVQGTQNVTVADNQNSPAPAFNSDAAPDNTAYTSDDFAADVDYQTA